MKLYHYALVLALALAPVCASAQDFDTRHYIYIEANAQVTAKADIATVNVSISEKAETSQAAIDASIDKATRLLQAIDKIGVPTAGIETNRFEFEKVYIIAKDKDGNPVAYFPDPNRDQLDGFRATNNMSIEVRDVTQLGAVLSTIAGLGAEVSSLTFTAAREDEYTLKAKQKAAESALHKARLYADTLGTSLGDILAVKEGTGYDTDTMEYPSYGEGEAADLMLEPRREPPVPISFPTLTFGASMAVKWAVEGARQ
ncbi:hypothetical protein ASC89_18750 [Devosia sp. Root413D1]|uniref:SIMPL domain-containing protein n=1 Tax=Devosia sp. Root413D1 TaxID=1736531 RepID=UPI0006FF1137|nr:SIMPL domain-containing protein [Devosia sp. Root413D1]KQW77237.1 hypothetical protein ASC89_18750 [Devosia sp. Root413D1]